MDGSEVKMGGIALGQLDVVGHEKWVHNVEAASSGCIIHYEGLTKAEEIWKGAASQTVEKLDSPG